MEKIFFIFPLHLLRKHPEDFFQGHLLDFPICLFNFGVEIFDGRGQISGHDFSHFVINPKRQHSFRRNPAAKICVFNDRQRMGDNCNIQRMLLDVFLLRVAHESPAFDMFHAGNIGKKVMHINFPFYMGFLPDDISPFWMAYSKIKKEPGHR